MKMVTEKQESVLISLDDLARAMQADDADSYEPEWEQLADEIETTLNNYIKAAKTVSVNGVNLFSVRRVAVDAYEYRNEDNDDDCRVGLLFYDRGNDSQEMALIIVDAVEANLRLRVSDGMGLVGVDTVDKLGRRF